MNKLADSRSKTEISAKAELLALAKKHGLTAEKPAIAYLSDTYAELSADNPQDSPVRHLCVNLVKAGVLSREQGAEFFIRAIAE